MAEDSVTVAAEPGAAPRDSDAPGCVKLLSLDDLELEAMGYKAELMRGFNGFMSFAFCFTAVAVLSSLSISFGPCLLWTGGPVVLVWGWLVCSLFTILVGCTMGEICSTYPSAGSVYHWAGQLAPEAWAPRIAYIDGWFNFMGNVAGDASFAFGFAQAVVAAQTIRNCPQDIPGLFAAAALNGTYDTTTSAWPPPGSGSCTTYDTGAQVGIAMAVCACWAALNILRVDQQGWLNNFAATWQVATTIAIVATILAHKRDTSGYDMNFFVWESWRNRSGLSDEGGHFGYVILIGLTASLFSFSGYEAGAHMAEETQNASSSSAWGLVATVTTTAAVGFLYILGILYAIPPELGIFETLTVYSSNAASLYAVATGNKVGLILTNVLVANLFFAGMSSLTVTSRIGFALARDGGLPFSGSLAKVSDFTKTPVRMVLCVFFIDCLLLLLPLTTMDSDLEAQYGPIAFNAVISITVIGYQISYAIPILLRVLVKPREFVRGDFHLGRFSIVVGWLSGLWLVITSLFLFWPSTFPVNKYDMNYTVVVVFGFGAVAAVYWFVGGARHTFKGPKRVDAAIFKALAKQKEAEDAARASLSQTSAGEAAA